MVCPPEFIRQLGERPDEAGIVVASDLVRDIVVDLVGVRVVLAGPPYERADQCVSVVGGVRQLVGPGTVRGPVVRMNGIFDPKPTRKLLPVLPRA
jgi:hypothetical protein